MINLYAILADKIGAYAILTDIACLRPEKHCGLPCRVGRTLIEDAR